MQTQVFNVLVSKIIVLFYFFSIMITAVYFDYQFYFRTIKIDNVFTYRFLSVECKSQLLFIKLFPKDFFSESLIIP